MVVVAGAGAVVLPYAGGTNCSRGFISFCLFFYNPILTRCATASSSFLCSALLRYRASSPVVLQLFLIVILLEGYRFLRLFSDLSSRNEKSNKFLTSFFFFSAVEHNKVLSREK